VSDLIKIALKLFTFEIGSVFFLTAESVEFVGCAEVTIKVFVDKLKNTLKFLKTRCAGVLG